MQEQSQYDAIVVGTGISGGWAAKELCEKGLKILVLERGRMVRHIEDYTTMNDDPWDYEIQGATHSKRNSRAGKTTSYRLCNSQGTSAFLCERSQTSI